MNSRQRPRWQPAVPGLVMIATVVVEVDQPLELWPIASDRQTVIFAEERMENALGRGRQVSLRAIDVATGQIRPAGSLSPEG